MVLEATHSQCKIVHVEKRDIDNVRRRVLNIERLRRDLKFLPRYTLEEGIRKTVEWFRSTESASHANPQMGGQGGREDEGAILWY